MAFYQTQLGKTLPVLWEHEEKDGKMFGFTENYVRVQKPFDASSINQIEMVKLDKIQPEGTVSISPIFEEFLAKVQGNFIFSYPKGCENSKYKLQNRCSDVAIFFVCNCK